MKISQPGGGRTGWVLWCVLLGLSFCLPIGLRAQNLSDADSGGASLPDAPQAASLPDTPQAQSGSAKYRSNHYFAIYRLRVEPIFLFPRSRG